METASDFEGTGPFPLGDVPDGTFDSFDKGWSTLPILAAVALPWQAASIFQFKKIGLSPSKS